MATINGGAIRRKAIEAEKARDRRSEEGSPAPEIGAAFRNGTTVDLITALRRDRPRTAHGYVHVGPAVLEEAADRLERLEAHLTEETDHESA